MLNNYRIKNLFNSSYFWLLIIYSMLLIAYLILSIRKILLLGLVTMFFILVRLPKWLNLMNEASQVFRDKS